MSVTKPARWAVSPAAVDPKWQWAWRGLRWFWDGGSYRAPVVGASNVLLPKTNWNTTLHPGRSGLSQRLESAASIMEWADDFMFHLLGDVPVTIAIRFDSISAGTGEWGLIGRRSAYNSGLWQFRWAVGLRDLSFVWHTGTDHNVFWNVTNPNRASDGDGDFFVAVRRQVGGTWDAWVWDLASGVGGKQTLDSAPDTTAFASTPGTHDFTIGRNRTDRGNSDSVTGDFYVVYFWDRALGDDEISVLARDPFGPIRPADSFSRDATWQDLNPTLRAIPGAADGP